MKLLTFVIFNLYFGNISMCVCIVNIEHVQEQSWYQFTFRFFPILISKLNKLSAHLEAYNRQFSKVVIYIYIFLMGI